MNLQLRYNSTSLYIQFQITMEVETPNSNKALNVQVAVRVRPLSIKEIQQGDQSVLLVSDNSVILDKRQFTYDQAFSVNTPQQQIFSMYQCTMSEVVIQNRGASAVAVLRRVQQHDPGLRADGFWEDIHDGDCVEHVAGDAGDGAAVHLVYFQPDLGEEGEIGDPGEGELPGAVQRADNRPAGPPVLAELAGDPGGARRADLDSELDGGGVHDAGGDVQRAGEGGDAPEHGEHLDEFDEFAVARDLHAALPDKIERGGGERGRGVHLGEVPFRGPGGERAAEEDAGAGEGDGGGDQHQPEPAGAGERDQAAERQGHEQEHQAHPVPRQQAHADPAGLARREREHLHDRLRLARGEQLRRDTQHAQVRLEGARDPEQAHHQPRKSTNVVYSPPQDPQTALIQSLKQQIKELTHEVAHCKQLLSQNNIQYVQQQEEQASDDQVRKLKQTISIYEKTVFQLQSEKQHYKAMLSDLEIESLSNKQQRDHFCKAFNDAKQHLHGLGITYHHDLDDLDVIDQYRNEVHALKKQLEEKRAEVDDLKKEQEQHLLDHKRDQQLLFQKMDTISKLKKLLLDRKKDPIDEEHDHEKDDIEEEFEEDEDPLVKEKYSELNQTHQIAETQLEIMNQELQMKENMLLQISSNFDELKVQLASDMKREYYQQIAMLEQEKNALQKQHESLVHKMNVPDNQMKNMKSKVQQLETQIQEMRDKEKKQKALKKTIEEHDNRVKDLQTNIEKIKKQKVDLQKKLKEENDKFNRFREERYRDLMMAKKQKVKQEVQMKKLKNENQRMEQLLKRKEDELQKLKNENLFKKGSKKAATTHKGQQATELEFETFEKQLVVVFEELIKGKQAEKNKFKEQEKYKECFDEVNNELKKQYQLELKKEQIIYDLNRLGQADCSLENELNQIEMHLNEVLQIQENLNETISFTNRKIQQFSDQFKKSQQYYISFLGNEYFSHLPNWLLRSIKLLLDNWVTQYIITEDKNQINQALTSQIDNLSSQLAYIQADYDKLKRENLHLHQNQIELQIPLAATSLHDDDDQKKTSDSPSRRKQTMDLKKQMELDQTKIQLKDFKKRNQDLEKELKYYKMNLDYYKGITKEIPKKDKFIGLNKTDTSFEQNPMPSIQLNNVQEARNRRKQEKMLSMRVKQSTPIRQVPSSSQRLNKKGSMDEVWISEDAEMKYSQEYLPPPDLELKWELVRSWTAHESPVLSTHTWENMLYSTGIKNLRIWDLESSKFISQLDLNGYVRTVCRWPEKNVIAVGHGSQITLFDNISLQQVGSYKAPDDVRTLCVLNGNLVSGGKGNPSAILIWDGKSNTPIAELEKGQEVFSMQSQDSQLFWGTRTHNVRYTQIADGKMSQIKQLDPPHYDRVTGLGILDNLIVSCSAGKDMRMWNMNSNQAGQNNTDIHKDMINTMIVDHHLQVVYTGSKDGIIKAVKIQDNKFNLLSDIIANSQITAGINSLAMIHGTQSFVAGSQDKTVKLWKPSQPTLEGLKQYLLSVNDFQLNE